MIFGKQGLSKWSEPWLFQYPTFVDSNGVLCVLSQQGLPIQVVRSFTVTANRFDERGEHAHLATTQVLYVVAGRVQVGVRNPRGESAFDLKVHGPALVIPPGNWAWQHFQEDGSVLLVLTDAEFDEADYVRDRASYEALIQSESQELA